MAVNGIGRPHSFRPEVGDAICERLVNGESLRAICRDPEMPSVGVVLRWVAEGDIQADESGKGMSEAHAALRRFREQYLRARQEQADVLADEIIDIADRATDPQIARLQIDSRKWYAGKVRPKVYGEGIALRHTGADGAGAVQVDVTAKSALVDGILDAMKKAPGQ
ncbi:MAG: hypothetical protein IOC86_04330 [Aestuariivirga sp.]|nr:hypothetical protein [Aestuariivirga sp.]